MVGSTTGYLNVVIKGVYIYTLKAGLETNNLLSSVSKTQI